MLMKKQTNINSYIISIISDQYIYINFYAIAMIISLKKKIQPLPLLYLLAAFH